MKWTERKRMEKRLRAQRFYESEIGRAVKEQQRKTYEANKDEIKKKATEAMRRKTKYFYTDQILDELDRYVVTESGHFVMAESKDRRKKYSVAEEKIDEYRKNGYVFVLKKTRQAVPAASMV